MAGYKTKKIIDLETLEVWDSLTECAKHFNVTPACITTSIALGCRVSGKKIPYRGERRLEYLDYWIECYTPEEKEQFTKKNNIFFI